MATDNLNFSLCPCKPEPEPEIKIKRIPCSLENFRSHNRIKVVDHVNSWAFGLCDCFSDFSICCLTCWCPCITFGRIAEILDKGSSSCGVKGAIYFFIGSLTGCACLYSRFYRSKMRQQFNLEESPCRDCLVHFFCETCALCQEYRELKSHGFHPSRGWQDSQSREMSMVSTAPTVENGMNR